MQLAIISRLLQDQRTLVTVPLAYLVLVRLLRFRRRAYHAQLLEEQAHDDDARREHRPGDLARMSVGTAQQIWISLAQREFPQLVRLSLNFALFRTYGVPSISQLLAATGRLSGGEAAVDRRVADTTALILEMTSRPLYGREWTEAVARLNCIHEVYIRQGRIAMDDLRYTLALFTLEPARWIARYDWRAFSDVERCATGVLWRAIGEAMGISWAGLRSFDAAAASRSGKDSTDANAAAAAAKAETAIWRDGLHFVDELAEWAEAYESRAMVPSEANARVAKCTSDMLLSTLPRWIRGGALRVLTAFMDARLRAAVAMPAPGPRVQAGVDGFVAVRRWLLRYLALPRPAVLRISNASDQRDDHGRVFLTYYQRSPFYIKPTLWNRFGPGAWLAYLQNVHVPGPEKFKPQGYVPREVGPNIGRDMQDDMEDHVKDRARQTGKCPFAVTAVADGAGDGGKHMH